MASSEEVYQALKARIDGGKLLVGATCPSEHELRDEFAVSRGTVRAALRRLAQEGYLEVAQGRRRRVRHPEPVPLAKLRLQNTGLRMPAQSGRAHRRFTPSFGEYLRQLGAEEGWQPTDDVLASPETVVWNDLRKVARFDVPEIAAKLRLKGKDKVTWFLRRRMGKGEPLVLQWVVVPVRIVTKVGYDDLQPGGLTRLYEGVYGIRRAFAEAHYRPTLVSRDEARLLRVERGSPLIEERRTSFFFRGGEKGKAADLTPYEHLYTLYTDRVSLDFSWHDR
jgi:GntR family transcriptional regulator